MKDDLPLGTGEWVRRQIERLGLGDHLRVVAMPGDRSQIDAFLPDGSLIQLSEETFFKRDPSFWAIGAHELGHALTYRRSLLVGAVLKTARGLSQLATSAGAAFLLANVLYGSPLVGGIALALLLLGLGLTLLVVA